MKRVQIWHSYRIMEAAS